MSDATMQARRPRWFHHGRQIAEEAALHLLQAGDYGSRGRRRVYTGQELTDLLARYEQSAVDAFLVLSHSELSAVEQAAKLQARPATLRDWRRRLIARGLLDPATRARRRPVTIREREAVCRLWRDGWSHQQIAEARGCAKIRIERIIRHAGLTAADRTPRIRMQEAADTLGIPYATFRGWVAMGALPDLRLPGQWAYSWTRDDLLAFLADRRYWMAWSPAQITDPALRQRAEDLRRQAGGNWLQLSEIADLLQVDYETLALWRKWDGIFTEVTGHIGGKYAWLSTGEQARLAAYGAQIGQHPPHGVAQRRQRQIIRARLRQQFGCPAPVKHAQEEAAWCAY